MSKHKHNAVPAVILVDTNIPPPVLGVYGRWYGLFEKMEVGNSLALPVSSGIRASSLIGPAKKWSKAHNPDSLWTTRILTEEEKEVVRIWRLK